MRLIRDSRGTPSWTHTLSVPACIGITGWFLAGGLDVTLPGGLHVVTATKTAGEYATALAPWLAYLSSREWAKRHNGNGGT